jgi:phospholipid-translocating ATPase
VPRVGDDSANTKASVFETHYKTGIVVFSFFLTTLGWWAWNAFLSGVYARRPSIYAVRDGFTHTYGRDLAWWATLLVVLGALGLLELSLKIVKRRLIGLGLYRLKPWKGRGDPGEGVEDWDLEVWQEMEQDPVMRERLRKMANGEEDGDGEDEDEEDAEVMVEDTAHQAV